MKFVDFEKWLVNSKGLKDRSAKDVSCRVRRVLRLINQKKVDSKTLEKLMNNVEFNSYSMHIRCHLKRSIILYSEFLAEN